MLESSFVVRFGCDNGAVAIGFGSRILAGQVLAVLPLEKWHTLSCFYLSHVDGSQMVQASGLGHTNQLLGSQHG